MKVLRFLQKWWLELWNSGLDWTTGVDSHKWESKIEIFRCLSGTCH
jgi:hypothetical protein